MLQPLITTYPGKCAVEMAHSGFYIEQTFDTDQGIDLDKKQQRINHYSASLNSIVTAQQDKAEMRRDLDCVMAKRNQIQQGGVLHGDDYQHILDEFSKKVSTQYRRQMDQILFDVTSDHPSEAHIKVMALTDWLKGEQVKPTPAATDMSVTGSTTTTTTEQLDNRTNSGNQTVTTTPTITTTTTTTIPNTPATQDVAAVSNTKPAKEILLNKIEAQLSDVARQEFARVLNPRWEGEWCENPDVASGDTDGSNARPIFLAIHADKMDVDDAGIPIFVKAVEKEAQFLRQMRLSKTPGSGVRRPSYTDLQKDPITHALWDQLWPHLSFRKSEQLFILIGDCLHDRYSTNKDFLRQLLEALFDVGVIIIRGNHDSYAFANQSWAVEAFGFNAKDRWHRDPAGSKYWQEFEDKILINAYWIEATDSVCCHHGVARQYSEAPGKMALYTGFSSFADNGVYVYSSGELNRQELVEWLNSRILPESGNANGFSDARFSDSSMDHWAKKEDVRMIHGHNRNQNDPHGKNIVNLDSTDVTPEESKFGIRSMDAVFLGKWKA